MLQAMIYWIQQRHPDSTHSTLAPWHGQRSKPHVATEDVGGWPDNVWGPSAIPFSHTFPQVKEMTKDQIKETIEAFGTAAKRAVEAGFDLIEIHGAHGYLITVRPNIGIFQFSLVGNRY